jgi:hypothetical protein
MSSGKIIAGTLLAGITATLSITAIYLPYYSPESEVRREMKTKSLAGGSMWAKMDAASKADINSQGSLSSAQGIKLDTDRIDRRLSSNARKEQGGGGGGAVEAAAKKAMTIEEKMAELEKAGSGEGNLR